MLRVVNRAARSSAPTASIARESRKSGGVNARDFDFEFEFEFPVDFRFAGCARFRPGLFRIAACTNL